MKIIMKKILKMNIIMKKNLKMSNT
jgi:hypothetical protein